MKRFVFLRYQSKYLADAARATIRLAFHQIKKSLNNHSCDRKIELKCLA